LPFEPLPLLKSGVFSERLISASYDGSDSKFEKVTAVFEAVVDAVIVHAPVALENDAQNAIGG